MNEPTLVPRDGLQGQRIALSVSESVDLPRLGLTERHCRLVVAEVGRAIMLAGGVVVYGGHLDPGGYTEILIDEADRFSNGRLALQIVLAESVYRELSPDRLTAVDRQLGTTGRLILVSESGEVVPIPDAQTHPWSGDSGRALTAMRRYVTEQTNARLLVGGRLTGYSGSEPGLIEEARLTIESGRLLLVAGGYGGAAAAVAQRVLPAAFDGWAPADFPAHVSDDPVQKSLDHLTAALPRAGVMLENEDAELIRTLTVSHRPADIASATVRLLSRDG